MHQTGETAHVQKMQATHGARDKQRGCLDAQIFWTYNIYAWLMLGIINNMIEHLHYFPGIN